MKRAESKQQSSSAVSQPWTPPTSAQKPKVKTFLLKLSRQNKRASTKKGQRREKAFQSCWFRLCKTKNLHVKEERQAGAPSVTPGLRFCVVSARPGENTYLVDMLWPRHIPSQSLESHDCTFQPPVRRRGYQETNGSSWSNESLFCRAEDLSKAKLLLGDLGEGKTGGVFKPHVIYFTSATL